MKTIALFVVLAILSSTNIYAQCTFEKYTQKGIKMLSQEHEGFTFLKSYEIAGAEGKKFSYIFTQGTSYLITLANNDVHSNGIYLSVYDSNDKLITTSKMNDKFYSAIQFNCKGTGVYQLKFNFEGANEHCAVAVLGMKR